MADNIPPNKENQNQEKKSGTSLADKKKCLPPIVVTGGVFTRPEVNIPLPDKIDSKTTITLNDKEYLLEAKDLNRISVLGKGAFGVVELMEFTKAATNMAVKKVSFVTSSDKEEERRHLLFELDVNMRISTAQCPYTVHHYGAIYEHCKFWMCFEVMDASLDLLYKTLNIHRKLIPEDILGKITFAVIEALSYLHTNLHVIHRDVKPSNILANRSGAIKLCDYGISGKLIKSVAYTKDAGCKAYMAPERVDPKRGQRDSEGRYVYDVRSDVWSLGITLVELATGRFPYECTKDKMWKQIEQITSDEPAPKLSPEGFTQVFRNFVDTCLIKDYADRPKYDALQKHQFLTTYRDKEVDVSSFVSQTLDEFAADYEKLRQQQLTC